MRKYQILLTAFYLVEKGALTMLRRNRRSDDFSFVGDYRKLSQLQKELVRNHAAKRRKSMMELATEWDSEHSQDAQDASGEPIEK